MLAIVVNNGDVTKKRKHRSSAKALAGISLTEKLYVYAPYCLDSLKPVTCTFLQGVNTARRDVAVFPFLQLYYCRCSDDTVLFSAFTPHSGLDYHRMVAMDATRVPHR